MTREQAEFIKEFRVVLGYSWKNIHAEWIDEYENNTISKISKTEGKRLCNEAMEMLNERLDDGWK